MSKDKNSIDTRITPPWGGAQQRQQQYQEQRQQIRNHLPTKAESSLDPSMHFVTERSKVHTAYIVEQEKSKRIGLILAVILLISAMLIMVFSPKEKEVISYWIGAALIIFSAGAAGYKHLWAKTPIIEIEAAEKDT